MLPFQGNVKCMVCDTREFTVAPNLFAGPLSACVEQEPMSEEYWAGRTFSSPSLPITLTLRKENSITLTYQRDVELDKSNFITSGMRVCRCERL